MRDNIIAPSPFSAADSTSSIHPPLAPRPSSFSGPLHPTAPTYAESTFTRDDTSYSGLDLRVVRELRKRLDTRVKLSSVVQRAIELHSGEDISAERVCAIVERIVEEDVHMSLSWIC
jgi:hypothetical protein